MPEETKSIIDPKYAGRYKDKEPDWLAKFITGQVTEPVMRVKKAKVKDDEGNETVTEEEVETSKRKLDVEKLFYLGNANGCDVEKFREQIGRKNAPGRLRMTIGNMLRAEARRRFGLVDLEGSFQEADAAFIEGLERTHNADGSKIEKPKAEEPTTESEEA